jgi:hypothetical protein
MPETTTDPTFDQLVQLWETNKLPMPRQYLTKKLDTELNEALKLQVCDILQNAIMDVLKLGISATWVHYNFFGSSQRPPKPDKYLVKRKDGKVHWEQWNGSGWAYNESTIACFLQIPE